MNMNESAEREIRLRLAINEVRIKLPYLSSLIELVRIEYGRQIPTAGIFASGRLIMNPDFFDSLDKDSASFVIAHEILHLVFKSHQRCTSADAKKFNIAHDYIINEQLSEIWGEVLAGGLDWFTSGLQKQLSERAKDLSAEEICQRITLEDLDNDSDPFSRQETKASQSTSLGDALARAGLVTKKPQAPFPEQTIDQLDVLPEHIEKHWFPDEDVTAITTKIEKELTSTLSAKKITDSMTQSSGGQNQVTTSTLEAEEIHFKPPWEMALQQWFEANARGGRSYSRPSRRGADRKDVVLAGYLREGWTLHIILDVSGSMTSELPYILGLISEFGTAVGIDRIHMIQADTEVNEDSWIDILDLQRFTVKGFGGSDMTSAMERLAQDIEVENVLLLTDGYISYADSVPYNVFWGVTRNLNFKPKYGVVAHIN